MATLYSAKVLEEKEVRMGEPIDLQAAVSAAHSRLAFAVACKQECKGLVQIVQSWGASLSKVTTMSSLRSRLAWHKKNIDRAKSEIIKAEKRYRKAEVSAREQKGGV